MAQRPRFTMASPRAGLALRLAIVFLLALCVKLAYVEERLRLPDVDHPTLDSLFHDQWARGLAFGEWTADLERVRHEPYFRAPLYPYFMSGVYRWLGTGAAPLFRIQALLGALTVVMMFCFCRLVFGERIAWIAAFLHLAYWPFTYHEAERMLPALQLPLDMALVLALALARQSRRTAFGAAAGLAAGLSAITRPSILVTLPFAALWLAPGSSPRRWRRASAFLLVAAMVIAPVTIRNLVVGHDRVLIAWQDGVNFYIGNNPQSNGVTAVVPGTRADWWGGFDDTRRIARESAAHAQKPSEISRYWYRRGLDFLVHQPRAAARLYLRKAGLLWGDSEPSNEQQLYFRRHRSAILPFLFVNFALIIAAAVVGWWALWRRGRATGEGALPLVMAIPYATGILLFFVTCRFRLPVAMFLIPLAAVGIDASVRWMRARDWRSAAPAIAVGLCVFAASLRNPYAIGTVADARGYYDLGVDRYHAGDYAAALDDLNRSLAADSSFAPAWAVRGRVQGRLGDEAAAIRDLQTACNMDTTFSDAMYWLGVEYQRAGQHARAEPVYLRAIAHDPTRVEALSNLADVYFREGRTDDAHVMLTRALAVDSTFVNAIYGMGYYYEVTGDVRRARAAYERALPFPPARIGLERLSRRGPSAH